MPSAIILIPGLDEVRAAAVTEVDWVSPDHLDVPFHFNWYLSRH